jgi:SNF2 family DNA or RNA helicase
MGTLWTLTKGNVAYLMEPNLDPGMELQAAKHEHRFGEIDEVTFIRFDCPSLVEEQKIVTAQQTTRLIKDSITRVIPNRDGTFEVVELDHSSQPSAAKKMRTKRQTVTDNQDTPSV